MIVKNVLLKYAFLTLMALSLAGSGADELNFSANAQGINKRGKGSSVADRQALVVQLGHGGRINCAALSRDDSLVASGGSEGTAILWEAATGRVLRRFDGHQAPVTSIAFSQDGNLVATGTGFVEEEDSIEIAVRVWDAKTGREVRKFEGFESSIRSLEFSSDNKSLLISTGDESSSTGGTALLLNVRTGKVLWRHKSNNGPLLTARFSPDGLLVAVAGGETEFRNGERVAHMPPILLLESGTGRVKGRLLGSNYPVGFVAFSPVGPLLVSSRTNPDYNTHDGEVCVWNLVTLKLERKFTERDDLYGPVAFSPDGQRVVVGGGLRLINMKTGAVTPLTGEESSTGGAPSEADTYAYMGVVTALSFSSDGRRILIAEAESEWGGASSSERVGENSLSMYDVSSRTFGLSYSGLAQGINTVSISEDGRYIRAGNSLWDTTTGSVVELASCATDESNRDSTLLAVSRDGARAVVASENSACLLSTDGQGRIAVFEKVDSAWFTPDGNLLFTWKDIESQNSLRVDIEIHARDARTGRGLWSHGIVRPGYKSLGSWFDKDSVRFDKIMSEDGKYLLLRNIGEQNIFIELLDEAAGNSTSAGAKGHDPESPPFALLSKGGSLKPKREFIPIREDGLYFLSEGWGDIELRKVRTRELVWRLGPLPGTRRSFDTSHFELSPDNRFLLAGGRVVSRLPGGGLTYLSAFDVWLLDVATGRVVDKFEGYSEKVFAFSPKGNYFALAGPSGRGVVIVSSKNRNELVELSLRDAVVTSVAFTPDERTLITGCDDGTTRLWDSKTGNEIVRFITANDGTWTTVGPKGHFDSNNIDRVTGLHWVMRGEPLRALPPEVFMRDYYEPRLLPRIIKKSYLPELPPLIDLNPNRPKLGKITVDLNPHNTELVDVKIEVSSEVGQCLKHGVRVTCESGVYDLRLYRDGQLVRQSPASTAAAAAGSVPSGDWRRQLQEWRRGNMVKTADGNQITASTGVREIVFTNIRLPQRTGISQIVFTAYAFNEDRIKSATSEPATYTLKQPRQGVKPRAYVITVGVDATSDPSLRLSLAPKGAQEIEHLLRNKLDNYYDVETVQLISEYRSGSGEVAQDIATSVNIQTVLEVLSEKGGTEAQRRAFHMLKPASPDDLVVLYIASHGYADPDGKFYVIPSDIGDPAGVSEELLDRCLKTQEQTNACRAAGEFLRRSISSDELTRWLRGIDAGQMVLILDSCHSAAVSGPNFKPGPMGDSSFGQLSYDKGMLVLAATQAENPAWGALALGDKSLLTEALINQEGQGQEQAFDMRRWLYQAKKRVPELYRKYVSQDVRQEQEPELFDFARRRTAVANN